MPGTACTAHKCPSNAPAGLVQHTGERSHHPDNYTVRIQGERTVARVAARRGVLAVSARHARRAGVGVRVRAPRRARATAGRGRRLRSQPTTFLNRSPSFISHISQNPGKHALTQHQRTNWQTHKS